MQTIGLTQHKHLLMLVSIATFLDTEILITENSSEFELDYEVFILSFEPCI